jgi:hypothetical protein
MAVSIPEKTLEHWLSLYLNYRYKSRISMWWPTVGEDINANPLTNTLSKQFWFELKTTNWLANPSESVHRLQIDLKQLWAYGLRGGFDYYVFPAPFWSGGIANANGRLMSADFVHKRAGSQWFVNWMYVVSGDDLRSHFSRMGTTSWTGNRTLGSFPVGAAPEIPGLSALPLREFLSTMDNCGGGKFKYQVVGDEYGPFSYGMSTEEFRHAVSNLDNVAEILKNPKLFATRVADDLRQDSITPASSDGAVTPLVVAIKLSQTG